MQIIVTERRAEGKRELSSGSNHANLERKVSMADTETTTNPSLETAREAVFDMEEDVRTLGEYAKVLLFMAAGCKTHGDATEALERVAIDMIARGEQLETKYATLWAAVGTVAQHDEPEQEAVSHD